MNMIQFESEQIVIKILSSAPSNNKKEATAWSKYGNNCYCLKEIEIYWRFRRNIFPKYLDEGV